MPNEFVQLQTCQSHAVLSVRHMFLSVANYFISILKIERGNESCYGLHIKSIRNRTPNQSILPLVTAIAHQNFQLEFIFFYRSWQFFSRYSRSNRHTERFDNRTKEHVEKKITWHFSRCNVQWKIFIEKKRK